MLRSTCIQSQRSRQSRLQVGAGVVARATPSAFSPAMSCMLSMGEQVQKRLESPYTKYLKSVNAFLNSQNRTYRHQFALLKARTSSRGAKAVDRQPAVWCSIGPSRLSVNRLGCVVPFLVGCLREEPHRPRWL